MENKLSYHSLTPHLRKFRICGVYPLKTDSPKWHKRIHAAYMIFIQFFIVLHIVQQIIKIYQVRDDTPRVIDTMFLLLTNTDSIYKQVVIWIKADQIEVLLDIMKGPLFNQGAPQHEKLLRATIRQAHTFLRGFNYTALLTCFLWSVYPLIVHIQGEHVEFAIWLPFDASFGPQFYYVMFYVWMQTSLVGFNNTSMDAFVSFLLAQSKTQLSIVRLELENLVTNSKHEASALSTPFQGVLKKRLHKIFSHYNEIIRFSKKQQDIFAGPTFYMFLVSAWILCTTAYRVISMEPTSVQFISTIMYMGCIVAECFVYCYIGNEVNYESDKLTESAYAMDWLQYSLRHRRDLIIFMERIKRPIKPMAGIIALCNSTFVSILRSSFSFYTFLKNSGD